MRNDDDGGDVCVTKPINVIYFFVSRMNTETEGEIEQ